MIRQSWLYILIALLLILASAASASLLPMSFGFPAMIQSTNSTAFRQSVGTAWDLESLDFSPFGTSTFGYPVVSQSGVQGQAIEATDFDQTTAFTAYSYPAITTGLTGFGDFKGFSWL
ncbi:MAG TPA: hypothetical protein VMC84_09115 [Methanocella sp.]|uniref:hypothetical protein n=1 Tax=Methanocella sp. TaxID=2052833 RepID=UPI002C957C1C|nr:hypothetical protein [Methanocella sp.]HTY91322.1 hypothetical protein [Methanocella sp.]